MRHTSSVIAPATLTLIIDLIQPALPAALRLAQDSQPWWHIPYVPFQCLCVLLAMDTNESLSHVQGAMETLRSIEKCTVGQTKQMHNVVMLAETLVRMCQKRKEEPADILAKSGQISIVTTLTSLSGEESTSLLLDLLEWDVAAQFEQGDLTWDDFFYIKSESS
jgi:hypothetical protein